MDQIADTSFLIGLWRNQPWAASYAGRNSAKSLGIPWIVVGEFKHGAVRPVMTPSVWISSSGSGFFCWMPVRLLRPMRDFAHGCRIRVNTET